MEEVEEGRSVEHVPYLFLDCFLYDTLDATSNNPWRRSVPIFRLFAGQYVFIYDANQQFSLSRLQKETGGDWDSAVDRAAYLHRRVIAEDFVI